MTVIDFFGMEVTLSPEQDSVHDYPFRDSNNNEWSLEFRRVKHPSFTLFEITIHCDIAYKIDGDEYCHEVEMCKVESTHLYGAEVQLFAALKLLAPVKFTDVSIVALQAKRKKEARLASEAAS